MNALRRSWTTGRIGGARRPRLFAATLTMIAITTLAPGGAGRAAADGVSLEGTSIPISGCRIESIRQGRVIYLDARGQRQHRTLDDVTALSFDGLPELDRAEERLAERDYAAGIAWLLKATVGTSSDVQRLWLHARLSRAHDLRGEFVLAAAHAARVLELQDDAAWVRLEPVSAPDEAGYVAAREAVEALQRAAATARSSEVVAMIDRMLKQVHPVYESAAREYVGPPIEPGSTISGVARATITATEPAPTAPVDRPEAAPPSRDDQPGGAVAPPGMPPPAAPAPEPTAPRADPDGEAAGSDDVAELLRSGRHEAALQACRRLERDPRDRGLARFLFQYGEALRLNGLPREAAVMYMRCAILYEGSREAVRSLMEAAMIHRETFGDLDAARRLLERAVDEARRDARGDLAEQARTMLDSLGGGERRR